jgi:hypothetical protein
MTNHEMTSPDSTHTNREAATRPLTAPVIEPMTIEQYPGVLGVEYGLNPTLVTLEDHTTMSVKAFFAHVRQATIDGDR